MRLAYLATHYPAVSHTFILREVRALRSRGIEVETISIHRAKPEELLAAVDREEAERTLSILPPNWLRLIAAHLRALLRAPSRYLDTLGFAVARANPGVRGRAWGLFYFAEAVTVWDGARRRGIRHLHAIFADGASDVALLVCRYGGEGWSWSLAIHGPVEFYDVYRNNLAGKLAEARFALAISDFGRSQLMTQVPEERWSDIHVVRCGLDPGAFTAVEHQESEFFDVLCVGRLVHLKGQSLLIEACAQLRENGIPARVTLVGRGPKRSDLEELCRQNGVQDSVVFTGAVGQDDLRSLFATADVLCLPSFAEGLPVVLMEAMAYGVPVITTRIMGTPELVEDGITGLLVPPGRVDALSAALTRLWNDPGLCRELAQAGHERVRSQYDVRASATTLELILRRHGL